MIRDLESEVVAVRNLVEALADALLSASPGRAAVRHLYAGMEKYRAHQAARFESEVEEAHKVLEKNWQLSGEDPHGAAWVPRREFEKLLKAYQHLDTANNKLAKEAGYTRN